MLFERMMRAARLDVSLYEEVEADNTATSQAATVVAIVAGCQGIGSAIGAAMNREGGQPAMALVGAVIAAFVGWVIWSYTTYFIGTRVFNGTATPGEMLRTIGFAQTPGVFGILGFIPCLGSLIGLAAGIWALVAGVIAIRQALDFDTGKAILTAIIGWALWLVATVGIALVLAAGGLVRP